MAFPAAVLPASPPRVLLLAPDPALRLQLAEALGSGWTPLAAPDAKSALAVARTFDPRLVVLAASGDALEFVSALRGDLRTGHLPVLALASGEREQTAALEAGADSSLPLGASPDLLRATAYRLLVTREELRQRWSHRAALALTDGAGDTAEDRFLRRVRHEAESGLGTPGFGVPHLSRALALSPRQFARRLKRLTGETPGALLRRVRLGRAAALLARGHSAKETAHAVGFRSRSQFLTAFREAFGTPPSAFAASGAAPPPEASGGAGTMSENRPSMSDF